METRPIRTRAGWLPGAATGVAAFAGIVLYVSAFRVHHMSPVGWDIFAYIWQTRAVGHATLSAVGTRPGVPVLAAVLGSIVRLPAARELVVLPIALAAALALGAAAVVRTSLRLSGWVVPILVTVILAWPGMARTLVGYEASLLLTVVLVGAIALLLPAAGRVAPLSVAAVLFLAAGLAHIAIFAAFCGIVAVYAALSIPSFLRDRRQGATLLATDAGGAVAAVGGGGLLAGAAIFGFLRFSPSDTVHTQSASFLFRGRTLQELRRVRPAASVPMAAVGLASAWRASRLDRVGRALTRLGLAWLGVSAVAVATALRYPSIPGGRFVLLALPFTVLAGLGLATAAFLVAGGRVGWRSLVAAALVVLVAASLARFAYSYVRFQLPQARVAISTQLREASAYLASVPGQPPVVVVVDDPTPAGAYTPKLRLNVIRAGMPDDAIARTFVYIGDTANLLAGRPTLTHGGQRWQQDLDAASSQAWALVRPALRDGAVVLILQRYDATGFERAVAADPSRQVAPGVYVLRGPVTPIVAPAGGGPFPPASAVAWCATCLMVLGASGWGVVRAGLRHTEASLVDVAYLAPAAGAGLLTVGAFVVAVVGGDPRGPAGILLIVAVAGLGLAWSIRSGRRPAPSPQAPAGRPATQEDEAAPAEAAR